MNVFSIEGRLGKYFIECLLSEVDAALDTSPIELDNVDLAIAFWVNELKDVF